MNLICVFNIKQVYHLLPYTKTNCNTLQIHLPEEATFNSPPGIEDEVSVTILQKYHPMVLDDFTPRAVCGDGNCLFRSVSLAFYGTESWHELLRLFAALEIIENRTYYDNQHRKYVDLICDDRIVCPDYVSLVRETCTDGEYACMTHLFALIASVGHLFRSYYPPTSTNQLAVASHCRLVYGRGVRRANPVSVSLMWTRASVPKSRSKFSPNHFVPLFPKQISDSYQGSRLLRDN